MQKEIKKTKVIFESDGRAIAKTRIFKHKPLSPSYGRQKIKYHRRYYWAEFVEANSFYDIEQCIWEKIDSSVLDYVYYDPDKRYLFVVFKSSSEYAYCYLGVSNYEYMKFMGAESKGTYLNRHIKPEYRCLKFEYCREEERINYFDIDNYMDEKRLN